MTEETAEQATPEMTRREFPPESVAAGILVAAPDPQTGMMQTVQSQTLTAEVVASRPEMMLLDQGLYDRLVQIGTMISECPAGMIPQEMHKKVGPCTAVAMQAMRWRLDPFLVAQKTMFISGKIAYEAQLIQAVLGSVGAIKGSPRYVREGDWDKVIGKVAKKTGRNDSTYYVPNWSVEDEQGLGVTVYATLAGESEPRELTVMLSQCLTRNSTLWASDPFQQLCYQAIKKFARLNCPGAILGVYTVDELEDLPEPRDVTPPASQPKQQPQRRSQAKPAQQRQGETIDQETGEVQQEDSPIAPGPLKMIQSQIDKKENVDAERVCKVFKVEALTQLRMSQVNDVLDWLRGES